MAWQGALARLVRRFRIRGSLGPGISSSNGCPEGDGLSCAAITLVGLCFHCFSAARLPRVVTCSYVDNLSGTGSHWQDILEAKEVYEEFAKAWIWSLTRRLVGLPARLPAGSSGHGVSQLFLMGLIWEDTCSTPCGTPISQLLPALLPLNSCVCGSVTQLRLTGRSFMQFGRAAAWPAGLHGCSLVGLGPRHFEQLRAAASKAVGMSGPGMNSRILLRILWQILSTMPCGSLCGTWHGWLILGKLGFALMQRPWYQGGMFRVLLALFFEGCKGLVSTGSRKGRSLAIFSDRGRPGV